MGFPDRAGSEYLGTGLGSKRKAGFGSFFPGLGGPSPKPLGQTGLDSLNYWLPLSSVPLPLGAVSMVGWVVMNLPMGPGPGGGPRLCPHCPLYFPEPGTTQRHAICLAPLLAHRVCLVTLVSRGSNRDSNVCWMEEKFSFFWGFLLLCLLFPLSGWGLRGAHFSQGGLDWLCGHVL